MTRPDEDRWFAEFQATGQPDALGRVFDRTAPRLLLLACHLAPVPADAEDLVQATFVTALQCAARYDPARPVFQWLAGILGNHARAIRRQARRPIDPERLRAADAPAPDAALADAEAAAAIDGALAALPVTYRTLLVLRLTHGLRPTAIAHALGRSPEVVRTQLHRGLELLRAALPQGIALTVLAALALEGRGLAAVRAEVLTQVVVPAGSVATGGLGGWFMAGKLMAVAGVALALGVAVVFWSVVAGEPASMAAPAAVATEAAPAAHGPVPPPSSSASRTSVPMPAVAPPAPHPFVCVGRCVAAEDQTPLAGCTVTLAARIEPGTDGGLWRDPAAVVSDGAGRFRIECAPAAVSHVSIRVRHPRRVPLGAMVLPPASGNVLDLGDVVLSRGVSVQGTVVDEAGATVDAVGVSCALALRPKTAGGFAPIQPQAVARDGGRFDLGCVPAGDHTLEVEPAWLLVSSPRLHCAEDAGAMDVRVVVRRAQRLAGVIVDPESKPVAGVEVEWDGRGTGPQVHMISTNRRGEFTVYAPRADLPPVTLRLRRESDLVTPLAIEPGPGPIPWGTQGIRIVVPAPVPADGVRLRVVDGRTGAPVEEFGYLCQPNPTRTQGRFSSAWVRRSQPAPHPGGITLLPDVRPGSHLVLIQARDAAWPSAGPVLFDTQAGACVDVVVPVRPDTQLPVQVVRRDGTPVPGAQVELLHPLGVGLPSLRSSAVPLEQPEQICCPSDLVLLRSRATTGADGIATLPAPAGQTGLVLRVLPVECAGAVVGEVAVPTPPQAPLRIVVADHAVLEGRIHPPGLVARLARGARAAGLTLLPAAGDVGQRLPASGGCFPVDGEGRFRISGVPPGSWHVMLFWASPFAGGSSQSHWFRPALATVTLADGQHQTLDLDARALEPAHLRGRIEQAGRPLAGQAWFLVTTAGDNRIALAAGPTDADGRFDCDVVLPGSYSLFTHTRHPRGADEEHQAAEILRVAAGEHVERTFTIPDPVCLTVALSAADGTTPAVGQELRWSAALGNRVWSGQARSDARGEVVLDPVPAFPLTFTVRDPETPDEEFHRLDTAEQARRTFTLGVVERAASQPRQRVRFTLPAR